MEAIIILSYISNPGGTLAEIGKERADAALGVFAKSHYVKIIASGGASGLKKKNIISEAEMLKEYLKANGVDESLIEKEERSRDTIGNAVFAKKIIGKENIKSMAIVTSDFHIQRAKYVFESVFGNVYKLRYVESKTKNLTNEILEHEKESFKLTEIFLNDKTKRDNLESLLYKFHPFYMETKDVKNLLKLSDERISKKLGINESKVLIYRKFIEKYLKSKK